MRSQVVLLVLSLGVGPVAAEPASPPKRPPVDPGAVPADLLWMIGPRDGRASRPPPVIDAGLRARGRKQFRASCASCHGEQGDGQGPAGALLKPRPTDFTRGVYKLRSTPAGSLPTDADLFATITRGMHGTAMQPWPQLSEADRWALVWQLKAFSPRFSQERPGTPVLVPIAPRETDSLRDRGERLYVDLRCGSCHGDTGAGDLLARERYRPDSVAEVNIRNFNRGRFIRGAEMEDIYVTLRVGIAGTPMAAYSSLSDHDIWALAAYVRGLIRERPLYEFPPARTAAAGPDGHRSKRERVP